MCVCTYETRSAALLQGYKREIEKDTNIDTETQTAAQLVLQSYKRDSERETERLDQPPSYWVSYKRESERETDRETLSALLQRYRRESERDTDIDTESRSAVLLLGQL